MIDQGFLGYLEVQDVVDAHLERVTHDKDRLEVVLAGCAEQRMVVQFRGVRSVRAHRPEGMAVYSVGEFVAARSLRRFVFVNWGDSDAALEIVARDSRILDAC